MKFHAESIVDLLYYNLQESRQPKNWKQADKSYTERNLLMNHGVLCGYD